MRMNLNVATTCSYNHSYMLIRKALLWGNVWHMRRTSILLYSGHRVLSSSSPVPKPDLRVAWVFLGNEDQLEPLSYVPLTPRIDGFELQIPHVELGMITSKRDVHSIYMNMWVCMYTYVYMRTLIKRHLFECAITYIYTYSNVDQYTSINIFVHLCKQKPSELHHTRDDNFYEWPNFVMFFKKSEST